MIGKSAAAPHIPAMRLPTLFIPHGGGPCFFLNPDGTCPPMWVRMRDYLAGLIADLPERPRAILLVSGHWEETNFTVHAGRQPGLLFDYYGFPAHTYQIRWDAPGAPEIAERVRDLLEQAGFPTRMETARGWDHGVFVPMKVADPEADIPLVQLSLRTDLDPADHIKAGQAIAALRDEGVLIVGSGMSFHNLRAYRAPGTLELSARFDDALADAATDPDPERRFARLTDWQKLPDARFSHPREEHLLPLMVAAGAGAESDARHDFRDEVLGSVVSAFRFGANAPT